MKKLLFIVGILLLIPIINSCRAYKNLPTKPKVNFNKLIAVSRDTLNYYGVTAKILKSPLIDYFMSDSLVLERSLIDRGSGIGSNGKLRLRDANNTETVIIPKGALLECFAVDSSGKMYMNAETQRGQKKAFLIFGPSSGDKAGTYVLYRLKGNKLQYGTYVYDITFENDNNILVNPDNFSGKNIRIVKKGVMPLHH